MMSYPGRHNIYEATIRRMVQTALAEQELQFRQAHETDSEEALLQYLCQWAQAHGHTPWPGELLGCSLLSARFGSWERAVRLAGLPEPKAPNRLQSFPRYLEEEVRQKELYRQRKAEKKQLARKRLASQEAKRREKR